jgi:predicted ATPase
MKIKKLSLKKFTAFEEEEFQFCDGINVLIGANGTGKSHAMKAMYELVSNIDNHSNNHKNHVRISHKFKENYGLGALFNISDTAALIRNNNEDKAILSVYHGDKKQGYYISLYDKEAKGFLSKLQNALPEAEIKINCHDYKTVHPIIYLPTIEMLSIYDHFFATYERQEIPYDRTCYDLALALNTAILRKTHADYHAIKPIIDNLQEIITGEQKQDVVVKESEHFYFYLNGHKLDVNLVADGYRKLGTLFYLLRNGSLNTDSILFWDEPEANLNPILIRKTVDIIRQLGLAGMQIFISTHDYLLVHELSLLAEYATPPAPDKPDMRFFALYKETPESPTQVETGKTLAEIQHNDILDEFAAHDDREETLFLRA